jgi:tRNA A-37 threonylcarbamoyl transferase component Bud32/TolB-like protein
MRGTTRQDRWREVERVLDRVLDLPASDRGEFLERLCGGDPELRAEVERLLRAHDRADGFLDDSLPNGASALRSALVNGTESARVASGAIIAQRYVVERELGHGAMAVVYLARDVKHRRPVALKVLDGDLARAVGGARFVREIEITAKLQHPHILPLYDSGEFEGLVYYVMPYVAGESLRDRLRREGRLSVPDALRIARDVAAALDHAHRRGVVHRDIKPANILLAGGGPRDGAGGSAEGSAIVADFGIARAVSETADGATGIEPSETTRSGVTLGTPAYMSPEQATAGHTVGASSDVYSLGCVLYQMLTGDPPFTGATAAAVIARHLDEAPPQLQALRPDAPIHVAQAVSRALAKNPADRFRTAGEFADALSARPARREATVGTWRVALGAALIVGTVGAITAVVRRDRPPVGPSAASIAVVPLVSAVPDTALTRLGRELVITLTASLEGVGGIRTVDALTVLANARPSGEAAALAEAMALARRLGARSVVHGSVMRVGDRARIDLALYPTTGGEPLARASVTALPNDVTTLTDSAAWGLLRQLWQRTDPPTPSLAAITTRSLPALRAFLSGERLIAGGRWRAASDAFQSAIALDSTFWLAYWRYAFTRDFNALPVDSSIRTTYLAHRREFPERDRQLVEAGVPGRLNERYERAKAITERFPDYWPGWWALSEHLAHTAPLFGTTDVDLRAALERTLALNPRMVSGLDHLFWVSLWAARHRVVGAPHSRALGVAIRLDIAARVRLRRAALRSVSRRSCPRRWRDT